MSDERNETRTEENIQSQFMVDHTIRRNRLNREILLLCILIYKHMNIHVTIST